MSKRFKTPTAEEVSNLRNNAELFKSNLFKLQLDELKTRFQSPKINLTLVHLKEALEQIPSLPMEHLPPGNYPFPIPSDLNLKFGFEIGKISVCGSWLLETTHKNNKQVDLVVEMPQKLIQEKDYLNNRYFYKRSFYLHYITTHLSKINGLVLEYDLFMGDARRPYVLIKSTPEYKHHFPGTIRLLPSIAQVFNPLKLSPLRNCVRPLEASPEPTPHYNQALLMEQSYVQHLNQINAYAQGFPSFSNAVLLIKTFLGQRQLLQHQSPGNFMNAFVISSIIGYLIQSKTSRKISKQFSPYQVLRVFLDLISNVDPEQGLFLTENAQPLEEKEFSRESFSLSFDFVLVDQSGRLNLSAFGTRSSFELMQYECKLALEMLATKDDHFADLFLTKIEPLYRFDNQFTIPTVRMPLVGFGLGEQLDYHNCTQFVLEKVHQVLRKGLNKRCKAISVMSAYTLPWSVTKECPIKRDETNGIMIGLVLDPELSLEQVEHGPQGNMTEETKEFSKLWGDKAELRRFKDGSIQTSVLFPSDGTLEQRALLVARMTAYLLQLHLGVSEDDGVSYWAGLGNRFLKPAGFKQSTNSFQPAMDAFQNLTKKLRGLRDLPLSISSVIPVSEGLRYTSAFIPQPIGDHLAPYEPLYVKLEFESSNKWPNQLLAVAKLKQAFFIKISQLMDASYQCKIFTGTHPLDAGYLDVFTPEGYLFRISIYYEKEHHLLSEANPNLLFDYYHQNEWLIWHSRVISNVSLRFPFYGYSVRLLKRWASSHMLMSTHGFHPQLLELLVAHVFLNPYPHGLPASGFTGFARTLKLIQSYQEPLILDFGDTTEEQRQMMIGHAEKTESTFFVGTTMDPKFEWYKIDQKMFQRAQILARACLAQLESQLIGFQSHDVPPLFVHPSDGYHALLCLETRLLPQYLYNITYDPQAGPTRETKFKNVLTDYDKQIDLLRQCDVVSMYAQDLEQRFGECCWFFRDIYGGDKILVVFKPSVRPIPFKVNLHYNAMPHEDGLAPNINAMLQEMQHLGQGLVSAVVVLKS
ncbi:Nrap protein [Gorgonomyces haynaldii]|nr:Nrap protein [Gorgonomyces haynaldii]